MIWKNAYMMVSRLKVKGKNETLSRNNVFDSMQTLTLEFLPVNMEINVS